jgi:hypothetical protein
VSRAIGILALLAAAAPAATGAVAQSNAVGGLHDAVTTERTASDPAALVAGLGRQRPEWLLWTVPAVAEARDVCCFVRNFRARECSLTRESQGWGTTSDFRGSGPAELDLLLEVVRGEPARLLLVGATCPVDAGGRAVTVLDGVDPAKSLDLVERLARTEDSEKDLGARALAAIGYHAGDEAGRRLERLTFDRTLDLELRKNALFWAGQTRPELGARLADRILSEDARDERQGDELREHALFVLSQAETPAAVERLKRAARSDPDDEVRSKALFWLSQGHDEKEAARWIYDAVVVERDREVREQGVFALSQVKGGVDYLLRLLRDSDHADVRKQALFWLGQSDDPRALDELARLLED